MRLVRIAHAHKVISKGTSSVVATNLPSLCANPYRPFCSARCKGVDLGAWASEEFKLPDDTPPDETFGDPRLQ